MRRSRCIASAVSIALAFLQVFCLCPHEASGWVCSSHRLSTVHVQKETAVRESADTSDLDSSPELLEARQADSRDDDVVSKLNNQIRSLRKIILHQQRQLEELQDVVKRITLPSATLFIDGTWLYYSLYERTTVADHFKMPNWQYLYEVDWHAVLGLLSRKFNVHVKEQYVFTSAKADTGTMSPRYTLFESLRKAGFNVDMQETVGAGEKCVDIKLATEMIAQDYDIGLILTGDKDFLPALTLCRQKQGKKIGLVSMREGCNRALSELDNVRDFDVLWLEDYVKEIFVRRDSASGDSDTDMAVPQISLDDHKALELIYRKVIYDFIVESGVSCVHARDLGRHLKKIPLSHTTVLDFIKSFHGGLSAFVASNEAFVIENSSEQPNFWLVSWAKDIPPPDYDSITVVSSDVAKHFRSTYTDKYKEVITKNKQVVYEFTYDSLREKGVSVSTSVSETTFDESMKKEELQKACENFGLSKWGTKAELITRLMEHQAASKEGTNLPEDAHLTGLLVSFLESQGGKARSRLVGRHLSNCDPYDSFHPNALIELKALYGTLFEFVNRSNGLISASFSPEDTSEFLVFLTSNSIGESGSKHTLKNQEGIRNRSLASSGTRSQLTERLPQFDSSQPPDVPTFHHLKDLLVEFLQTNGGSAGSRDIGRYLVSKNAYNDVFGDALTELKSTFGSLAGFISYAEGYFRNNGLVRGSEFEIALETESSSVTP